tara:strand:- start:8027 stop:8143 length:117 start_codon:yes stop_codon:yes gene_type:complete
LAAPFGGLICSDVANGDKIKARVIFKTTAISAILKQVV